MAGDLIPNDGVDIMMVASTPETVPRSPTSARRNGVPCVSNDCPWQPYFFGRKGDPANPCFKWTYHFFWGSEAVADVFIDMWDRLDTNKKVGVMWPNDADGNAWADPKTGLPTFYGPAGYKFVDPGRYQNGTEDFTAQIGKFKAADVEIVTGVLIPPDFTNFWKQASQQGFKPVVATMAKALLFPSAVEALGDIGNGLTTEVWWTPQPPVHVVAHRRDAASRSPTPTRRPPASSGRSRSCTTPCSRSWPTPSSAPRTSTTRSRSSPPSRRPTSTPSSARSTGRAATINPVPNVSKTPLVGGQWVKGDEVPVRPRDRRQLASPPTSRSTASSQPMRVLNVTDPTRVPSSEPRRPEVPRRGAVSARDRGARDPGL